VYQKRQGQREITIKGRRTCSNEKRKGKAGTNREKKERKKEKHQEKRHVKVME